ncbi:unnamed protein product [Brassica rapa subsp. trilocularis]
MQTRVFKYVAKEIGEVYPTWDNDAVDVSVKNLVEFMFAKHEWKWTQECWPAQGTKQWTNPVYLKKEPHQRPVKEESRAPKKARTEAESSAARNGLMREKIELMFKEMTKVVTARIGHCGVKEIKLLGDRMEAMEKIVGINKKNTDHNELQLTVSELEQNKPPRESESVNGDKRERENTETSGMKEKSVIILGKTKATKSDLKKEEGRRDKKKKMLLWNCAVQRVNERGSLLRHRNLLFRETAQPNRSFQPRRLVMDMNHLHRLTRRRLKL